MVKSFQKDEVFRGITQKLNNAAATAAQQMADDIAEDVQAFIPTGSGKLQEALLMEPNGRNIRLSWEAPYARAVYYGSGKGRLWFEAAKASCIDRWIKSAGDAFRDEISRK